MRQFSITFGDSSVELPLGESILGRDKACRVRFSDLRVSRQHVRICVSEDRATVEDLVSSNGTRRNGRPLVSVCALGHGDLLELGGTTKLHVTVRAGQPLAIAAETLEPDTLLLHAAELADGRRPTAELAQVQGVPTNVGEEVVTASRSRAAVHAERRLHSRASSSVPVCYDSDTLNFDAYTRDLSDGGVFVVSEILDQVGTPCSMTIVLDGVRPFSASGVVRHVVLSDAAGPHPPGMGIQFTELRG